MQFGQAQPGQLAYQRRQRELYTHVVHITWQAARYVGRDFYLFVYPAQHHGLVVFFLIVCGKSSALFKQPAPHTKNKVRSLQRYIAMDMHL